MISDKALAANISERLLRVNSLLNEMANLVQNSGEENELRPFCLAIAKVSGELLLEVANPLYRKHPELKPPEMD
jgi:hypothetical protein